MKGNVVERHNEEDHLDIFLTSGQTLLVFKSAFNLDQPGVQFSFSLNTQSLFCAGHNAYLSVFFIHFSNTDSRDEEVQSLKKKILNDL